MNNQYIILTAMYRYELLFMKDSPSMEQIKETLSTTNPHTIIPGSKLIVKKALNENYGVNSKQSMEQVVSELIRAAFAEGITYAAMIDLFLHNSQQFLNLKKEQVETYFSEENRISEYIRPFEPAMMKYGTDIARFVNSLDTAKEVLYYFDAENVSHLKDVNALFEENQSWLASTNGLAMAGFNFSRIISIVTDANICGYVTEEETEELLNLHGSVAEVLFKNWETFLFSAVLGKQLMSAANGTFIVDSMDYIKNCYRLAVHPAELLKVTGLWADSDLAYFCSIISKKYNLSFDQQEETIGESNPSVNFLLTTVLPVFEKHEVAYLFDPKITDIHYNVPVANENSADYYMMQDDVKHTKFEYGADEIPFMVRGKKLLVTSRKIYVLEKKLLSKRVHVFQWSDKLDFSYTFSKWDQVLVTINGIAAFTLPRNYKKLGINMIQDSQMDKKEVMEHYGTDIQNSINAFMELNQLLGGGDLT